MGSFTIVLFYRLHECPSDSSPGTQEPSAAYRGIGRPPVPSKTNAMEVALIWHTWENRASTDPVRAGLPRKYACAMRIYIIYHRR